MSGAQQCPRCHNSLVGVASNHGTIICPACQGPISELEMFSATSSVSSKRSNTPKGSHKLLIPLGYATFVIVPAVIAVYLFISYSKKPPEVQAENTIPEEPTQVARTNPDPNPKKNQPGSTSDKTQKNSGGSTSDSLKEITDALAKLKNDRTANPKTDTGSNSKEDALPMTVALETAPDPRVKLFYGTLMLVTSVAVKEGVEAWIEIDGKKEKTWKVGNFQVELKVVAGEHNVKVISIYKGVRRNIYEGDVEITTNKLKEVSIEPKKE